MSSRGLGRGSAGRAACRFGRRTASRCGLTRSTGDGRFGCVPCDRVAGRVRFCLCPRRAGGASWTPVAEGARTFASFPRVRVGFGGVAAVEQFMPADARGVIELRRGPQNFDQQLLAPAWVEVTGHRITEVRGQQREAERTGRSR